MHLRRLPYIIYFLGICYIAYLALSLERGVFFSGDGGMKYMVVKQISNGEGFKYLHTPQPEWVRQLWDQGFFPVRQPFTYPSPKGYIISFPPAFQVVSAFFYSKMGYRGLYVIPICSMLLLWIAFLYLLDYLRIDAYKKSIGLFVLIFCSPLTVYAATYWEHALAVLLLFIGFVFIIKKQTRIIAALLMGLCGGLAVWLRPEAMAMNFLFALAAWLQYKKGKQNCFAFLAMLFTAMFFFFIANYMIYGSMLGVHSYQVLEEHTWIYKILRGIKHLVILNWLLVYFFCLVLLTIPVFIRISLFPELKIIAGILLFYCVLTPFIVPNLGGGQWGPRYLLPAIPIALVMLLMAGQRKLPNILIVIMICYSFYLNVYEGGYKTIVKGNHNRVKPALDYMQQQEEKVIVVSSEFIPMELAAIFNERYFFLAENKRKLDSLTMLLQKQHIKTYFYITDKKENDSLVQKGMYYLGKRNLLTTPASE